MSTPQIHDSQIHDSQIHDPQIPDPGTHDVVIVGAGPTGLAAARGLVGRGVTDVVVLEREAEAGGIPRHCGHGGFGWMEFRRLMSGPALARRMVAAAAPAQIHASVTVTALRPDGLLELATPDGPVQIRGRRVLLATGVRETPRAARLVSGGRPWGVMTTGALQQFVYLARSRPFRRAVIVGSELVSFSAVLTLRSGGIEAAAMIEENPRITARRPGDLIARHLFGVPVLTGTRLVSIEGESQVEGVVVEHGRATREIACDGVVFSGRFQAENALLRPSHLALDSGSGGPRIDQFGRCSDPAFFSGGNLTHPVESAGRCYREGLRLAESLAADLEGRLPGAGGALRVEAGGALRYLSPQVIALPDGFDGRWSLIARAAREVRGVLQVTAAETRLWSRRLHALPERRLIIPARVLAGARAGPVRVILEEA